MTDTPIPFFPLLARKQKISSKMFQQLVESIGYKIPEQTIELGGMIKVVKHARPSMHPKETPAFSMGEYAEKHIRDAISHDFNLCFVFSSEDTEAPEGFFPLAVDGKITHDNVTDALDAIGYYVCSDDNIIHKLWRPGMHPGEEKPFLTRRLKEEEDFEMIKRDIRLCFREGKMEVEKKPASNSKFKDHAKKVADQILKDLSPKGNHHEP